MYIVLKTGHYAYYVVFLDISCCYQGMQCMKMVEQCNWWMQVLAYYILILVCLMYIVILSRLYAYCLPLDVVYFCINALWYIYNLVYYYITLLLLELLLPIYLLHWLYNCSFLVCHNPTVYFGLCLWKLFYDQWWFGSKTLLFVNFYNNGLLKFNRTIPHFIKKINLNQKQCEDWICIYIANIDRKGSHMNERVYHSCFYLRNRVTSFLFLLSLFKSKKRIITLKHKSYVNFKTLLFTFYQISEYLLHIYYSSVLIIKLYDVCLLIFEQNFSIRRYLGLALCLARILRCLTGHYKSMNLTILYYKQNICTTLEIIAWRRLLYFINCK